MPIQVHNLSVSRMLRRDFSFLTANSPKAHYGTQTMDDKTRVFICYKKIGADGRENGSATRLLEHLKTVATYAPWMDENMPAGVTWERSIYKELISSDVVLLVVGAGTSQSEWVRREISIAQSFDIQIIPVGLNLSEADLRKELNALDLAALHYRRPFNISQQASSAILGEIEVAIETAKKATREKGHQLIQAVSATVSPAPKAAKSKLSAYVKKLSFANQQINLHIASGDIFDGSEKLDIFVNSENDYMQMGRLFDSPSISASLRYLGSSQEKGYLEDTLQIEIEKQISGRPRPVLPATTVVTSSGAPFSDLYRTHGVTHVVHVAAVQGIIANRNTVPLRGEGDIRRCIFSALEAVQEICRSKGVVSAEGTAQRRLQEELAASFAPRRLILPLFGSGRGGSSVAMVGPQVVDAIIRFFSGPRLVLEVMPIQDIHLVAYLENDTRTLISHLSNLNLE
jgi:hypothetical protein